MRDLRMVARAELALHVRRLGLGRHARELDPLRLGHFHAVEPGEEIEMPIGPPQFAVGDRTKSDRLLLGDDLLDLGVFDCGEFGRG